MTASPTAPALDSPSITPVEEPKAVSTTLAPVASPPIPAGPPLPTSWILYRPDAIHFDIAHIPADVLANMSFPPYPHQETANIHYANMLAKLRRRVTQPILLAAQKAAKAKRIAETRRKEKERRASYMVNGRDTMPKGPGRKLINGVSRGARRHANKRISRMGDLLSRMNLFNDDGKEADGRTWETMMMAVGKASWYREVVQEM